jgi:hypothetical protein
VVDSRTLKERKARYVYITSSLDVLMSVYLRRGSTAAQVYEELRALYKVKTFFSVGNKAIKRQVGRNSS